MLYDGESVQRHDMTVLFHDVTMDVGFISTPVYQLSIRTVNTLQCVVLLWRLFDVGTSCLLRSCRGRGCGIVGQEYITKASFRNLLSNYHAFSGIKRNDFPSKVFFYQLLTILIERKYVLYKSGQQPSE